jgi:hypothetical protein
MSQQFIQFDFECALFKGNPADGGVECDGRGYDRAYFGEPAPAFFGPAWGLCNRYPIVFPQADENWECTHLAFMARHFDTVVASCPLSDAVMFADATTSALGSEEVRTVPEGHSIVLPPNSMFLMGNIVSEVLDLSGNSKFVN